MKNRRVQFLMFLLLFCYVECTFYLPNGHSFNGRTRIIIVEDAKACFRRALAGKRVVRGLVRRALPCERVEDCQIECSQEKRFVCEGFNYRLDPKGRGNGDCELLDMPLLRFDLRRDIVPDPDFDYYELNRNSRDCDPDRVPPRGGYLPHQQQYDREDIRGGDHRRIGLYGGDRNTGMGPIRPDGPRDVVPYRGEERRPSYGDSRRYYFDDNREGGKLPYIDIEWRVYGAK